MDAEGQDFGGEPVMNAEYFILEGDEVDDQGNIYPKHRTILWAMGGWQRLHTSTELAAGIGLPTLGKECPSFFLGDEDKHMLHAVDIIEWLFESSANTIKRMDFPMV